MKRTILAAAAVAAAALAAVAAALVGPGPGNGTASSHREAPLISEDPVADNTDVYAFVSPDKPDTVTILANYIPLEEPAGGPNFNGFGDDVLYELKVDNTGDGDEDISYQFRFRTETRNPNTFLYNTGPIDTLSDTGLEPAAVLQRHPRRRQGGGIIGGRPDGARAERPDPARRHRPALDAELRLADGRGDPDAPGRRQGLRRPARRPVLRRPRLGLRPRRAAAVQPRPRDPAAGGERASTASAASTRTRSRSRCRSRS